MILATMAISSFCSHYPQVPINILPSYEVSVETTPYPIIDNWVTLPSGQGGELCIHVKAERADKINYWKIPTGTNTWPLRELLFVDTNKKDGWSYCMPYKKDELLHDHIKIEVIEDNGLKESITFQVKHY
ncbi:hypothetical protein [Paenibacillus marinisediminis]